MVRLHCFVLLATRRLQVYGCHVHMDCTTNFSYSYCKFSSVFYWLGVIVANAALHVCKTSVYAIAVAS